MTIRTDDVIGSNTEDITRSRDYVNMPVISIGFNSQPGELLVKYLRLCSQIIEAVSTEYHTGIGTAYELASYCENTFLLLPLPYALFCPS